MKREFSKLSPADKSKSRKDLTKFYDDNLKQGLITKKYYDLKKPLTEMLKNKKSLEEASSV